METSDKPASLKPEPGALYVSSNPKAGPVTRHALMAGRGRGVFEYIGARRDPKSATEIIYDPKLVVMIPAAEYSAFRREFNRALASGSLVARKFEDFKAQVETEAKEEAEALRREELEVKKLQDAQAKADKASQKSSAPEAPAQ